jgi:hypothetical protein
MADVGFVCSLCVLVVCTGLGVFAPGLPRRFPERLFLALIGVGLSLAGVTVALSAAELLDWAVLVGSAVPSIFMLCFWLVRWAPRRDDGGGDGGDGDFEPVGPIDWDRFDRERARWPHPRQPVA